MRLPKLIALATSILLLLPVVAGVGVWGLILATVNTECTTTTTTTASPGAGTSGRGGFEETAYGPPWGGIQGGGITAYGINLTAGQPMLEIAIDPTVLTPLAYYHVWPNPFDTHGAFIAGDTGGAIKGEHIDTYDWLGRANQDAWGVHYAVTVSKAANPGAGAATGELTAPPLIPDPVEAGCIATDSAGGGVSVAPGVYVNPFHSSTNMIQARIDQGVDYSGSGAILAIGDAQVTYSAAGDAGWGPFSCSGGHGGAIVYRLTDGPDQGRYVYTAEGVIPTVQQGQALKAGEPIATFTGCIEIGWASGSGDQPMAQVTVPEQACIVGDPGCHSSWCGNNMSELIQALGGPPGIPQGSIYGEGC